MSAARKVNWVRKIGIAEGLSFLLLLFVAMPLKYFAGQPLAVRIVGSAHGALFVAYGLAALVALRPAGWTWKTLLRLFVASLIPGGPFFIDAELKRDEEALALRSA